MTNSSLHKPLCFRKLWLVLGLALIILIVLITLTPRPPELMNNIKFGDKIGHFSAYALLILWYTQLYSAFQKRLILGCSFILMGIILEFLQGLGGIRMYEVADMFANGIGVLIGFVLAYLGMDKFLLKFEEIIGFNKQV